MPHTVFIPEYITLIPKKVFNPHFQPIYVFFFKKAAKRGTFAIDLRKKDMKYVTMRLDNASNIYPAALTKRYASIFRMSVILTETINLNILQQALNTTVQRIPLFAYTLKNGAFWWYLRQLDKEPTISEYTPNQDKRGFKFHGGFLFKVSADGNRILLDVFHALADGRGGQTFLLTLTAEYIRLRYEVKDIEYNDLVLNPKDKPFKKETEDCFVSFAGKKGALEQNELAYHIHGRKLKFDELERERYTLSSAQTKSVCGRYGCTITELLTASMVSALQQVYLNDKRKHKRTALKVSVPVDLRPIFSGKTLRNFSSYVNLGVNVNNGQFSFDEILDIVKSQKHFMTQRCELEKKIAANVALENNFAISAIPLFIKHPIIDFICRTKGDRYCSQTLSNLGNVVLPEAISPYVKEIDFILGRQRGTSGAASAIGYNGKIFINFTRNIAEKDFEDYFCDQLRDLGINVISLSELRLPELQTA